MRSRATSAKLIELVTWELPFNPVRAQLVLSRVLLSALQRRVQSVQVHLGVAKHLVVFVEIESINSDFPELLWTVLLYQSLEYLDKVDGATKFSFSFANNGQELLPGELGDALARDFHLPCTISHQARFCAVLKRCELGFRQAFRLFRLRRWCIVILPFV